MFSGSSRSSSGGLGGGRVGIVGMRKTSNRGIAGRQSSGGDCHVGIRGLAAGGGTYQCTSVHGSIDGSIDRSTAGTPTAQAVYLHPVMIHKMIPGNVFELRTRLCFSLNMLNSALKMLNSALTMMNYVFNPLNSPAPSAGMSKRKGLSLRPLVR